MAIRIRSISDPFDSIDPDVVSEALDVIALADAMGLIPGTLEQLDLSSLRRVAASVAEAGIATVPASTLRSRKVEEKLLRSAIRMLRQALEDSPAPASEWRTLVDLFGVERLAQLTSVSPASLRRYAAGSRPTPDDVAARAHFLAKVVGDLRGAYNDIGIRRWFDRKRTQLGGRPPAQLLKGAWNPDEPSATRVRELARSLVFSPAT